MSIAPKDTDLVDIQRRRDAVTFAVRVGHHIIHLGVTDVATLLALLTQYPNGTAGQAVLTPGTPTHGNPVLVAHVGAGSGSIAADRLADQVGDGAPGTDPYRQPAPGYEYKPNRLTLALTAGDTTYVAVLPKRRALSLIHAATRGLSDAL